MHTSLIPLLTSIHSGAATVLLSAQALSPAPSHTPLPLTLVGLTSALVAIVIVVCWMSIHGHHR